jgi:hypothetical protein
VRTRVAAALTALATLAAVAGVASVPASAQTPSQQAFAGYGSGAVQSVNVLNLGGTQLLNAQTASAGQSFNSQGLPAAGINNEMGYIVQPTGLSSQNAYGRGTGAEVGLATQPTVDPNQILLSGLSQASTPPLVVDSPKDIGPVKLGGLLYADVLHSEAGVNYDPNICAIGKPLTFGEGEAAGAQLVGTPDPTTGQLTLPLVGAALPPGTTNTRNANRTRSVTYLRPNGDGTYAVVSEERQTIAPVSLLGGQVTLELLGEWALRVISTGKPGGSTVEYAPVGAGPTTPVLNLTLGGGTPTTLTFQQVFGNGGLDLSSLLGPGLSALLDIKIGTPPRAIGGTGAPALAADGTSASAAVDVVKITVLSVPNVIQGADIRIGHMEGAAIAPPGGVKCNVPVSKVGTPDPVTAGQDFTININIPSDAGIFQTLFGCDLIGIKVVDVHTTDGPSYTITGASNGGVITTSGDTTTITWANVGNYHIGDPPIVLTVNGHIPSNSPAGTLTDTANVTASLGNCNGTGGGQDIVGQAVNGGVVNGTFTLVGPQVSRSGVLASTGGDERLLLLGGVFLLAALGVRRRLRRPVRGTTA